MAAKPFKNRDELDSLRNFYYLNTYPDDEDRANHMSTKVFFDLKPFSEYIKKSIDNIIKSSKIKAECFKVEQKRVLKPLDTLLRVTAVTSVLINKPEGFYYVIEWNEEWGDTEEFDALCKGRHTVCENTDVLDVFDGKLFFKSETELDISANYKLYLKDESDYNCLIKKIDYSDCGSFRTFAENAKISASAESGGGIVLYYTGEVNDAVILFDKVVCKVVERRSIDLGGGKFTMGNIPVRLYNSREGLLIASCKDEEEGVLYCNNEKIAYSVVGRDEICSLLGIPYLTYQDGKIVITENGFDDDKPIIKGIRFSVNSLSDKLKYRYPKSIYIELIEDENFTGDIYSNTSYFFKETTEYLTDSPERGGRRFKIGYSNENYNQIEIAEVDKRGNIIPMGEVPKYLYIEPNTRQLDMQKNALKILMNKPCAAHAPLLELMNDKRFCKWRPVPFLSVAVDKWYRLTNDRYEGCDSQREFVKKVLATPDFAILEGPPGSGKTTTILEIIAQMVMRGQKVMLAASTNAAIDNILERLNDLPNEVKDKILAVRIGNENAISDSVQSYTVFDLDRDIGNEIIKRANLVCGTIIGVLQHPEFNLQKTDQPVTPLYDCLIVDEASKTTFQEFLVPAIYAKKWVLSGDLKQLTPYIEQDSIVSALTQIEGFDIAHQSAQFILMTLEQSIYKQKNDYLKSLKFCICAENKVLEAATDLISDYPYRRIAFIGDIKHEQAVSLREYLDGNIRSAVIYGADIVFVDNKYYEKIQQYLPSAFIPLFARSKGMLDFANAAKYRSFEARAMNNFFKDITALKERLQKELKEKSWASEIAWRLCREQELFLLSQLEVSDGEQKDRYRQQIEERIPECSKENIKNSIGLLKEIALPSIIQLLQQGVTDRNIVTNNKLTTLNQGFDNDVLQKRHTLVEYQHRMHDDISAFSAKYIYEGKALRNGKTIDRSWAYSEYPRRNYWLNVDGEVVKGKNIKEVERIAEEIKKFLRFAKENPKNDGKPWTIACLTYYRAQESELKKHLRKLLSKPRDSSYYMTEGYNAEIMIYTVDKFQGKEADLVFLSMIKNGTAPLGFMDSPNRLNVALTRAKYQIVLVGSKEYFKSNKCKSELLKHVAEEY